MTSIGDHPWLRNLMALEGRRSLYDLLRLRASPSVKLTVEGAMRALIGIEYIGSGRLSSGVSSKSLLLQLSELLGSLRHPFDGGQIRVCIVDFLATMGLGCSRHDVIIPRVLETTPFHLGGRYDVVVIHGVDALPQTMESDWMELLEGVIAGTNVITIMVDAVYHSCVGVKWDKTDQRIVVLKRPARAQNLLRL